MDTSPILFQILVFVLGAHLVLTDSCVDKCNFPIKCYEVEYVQVTPCSYKCTCDGIDTYHFEDMLTPCGFDKKCFQGECLNVVPHCEFLYGPDYIGLLNQNNPCLYNCFAGVSNCFYTEENMPNGVGCYTFSDAFGRCLRGRCVTGYSSSSPVDEPEEYGDPLVGFQSDSPEEAYSDHDVEGRTGPGEDNYAEPNRESANNKWRAADMWASKRSSSPSSPVQAKEIFEGQEIIGDGEDADQLSPVNERREDSSRAVTNKKSSHFSYSVNHKGARKQKSSELEGNDNKFSSDSIGMPESDKTSGITQAMEIEEGYLMEYEAEYSPKGAQSDAGMQGVSNSADNNEEGSQRSSVSSTQGVTREQSVSEENENTNSNSVARTSSSTQSISSSSSTQNVVTAEETESSPMAVDNEGFEYESLSDKAFREESDVNHYSASRKTDYAGTRGITRALEIGESFSRTGNRRATGAQRADSKRAERDEKANRYSSPEMRVIDYDSSSLPSQSMDGISENDNRKSATSMKKTGKQDISSGSRFLKVSESENRYSASDIRKAGYNKQQSTVSNSASEMGTTEFASKLQSQSIIGASMSSNTGSSTGTTGYYSPGVPGLAMGGVQSFDGPNTRSNTAAIGGAAGYHASAAQLLAAADGQSVSGTISSSNTVTTAGASGYASSGTQGLAAASSQSIAETFANSNSAALAGAASSSQAQGLAAAGSQSIAGASSSSNSAAIAGAQSIAGASASSNSAAIAGAAGYASLGAQSLAAAGAQGISGASSNSNSAAVADAAGYSSSGAQGLAMAGSIASSSASSTANSFAGSSGSAFGEASSLSSAFSQSGAGGI